MRILWAFLVLSVFAEPALTEPVPPPPDGYSSDQYIDGQGCVFTRENHGWIGQTDSKGRPVCGFPASLSARRTDPDTISILRDEVPPVKPDPEVELTRQLASALRKGEFVADKREPEKLKEFPTSDGGFAAQVEGQVHLQNALRTALADGAGNTEICRRLGYRPSRDFKPILGHDVTQGFCPGMIASEPGLKISYSASTAAGAEGKGDHAAVTAASETRSMPKIKGGGQSLPPSRKPDRKQVRKKAVKPASLQANTAELIPATARYVEVGTYAATNAAATARRRVAGLGYPVTAGHQITGNGIYYQVFAGPFEDRRSLVVALKLLREKGFPSSYAR